LVSTPHVRSLLTPRKGEKRYYRMERLYCLYIEEQKKSINKEQKRKDRHSFIPIPEESIYVQRIETEIIINKSDLNKRYRVLACRISALGPESADSEEGG
jgi:hypothetical protein